MSQLNSKTFSVVIPLYNKRDEIVETLNSVFAQSFKDFEVIVVDDGSNDGGPNLVEKHFLGSVKLIRQLNQGVSIARNEGVKVAKGKIIAFLDADDSWEPHFLEEIDQLATTYPTAKSFGTSYQLKQGDDEFKDPKIRFREQMSSYGLIEDYFDVASRGDLPFMMSSFCIERKAFIELGGFPEHEAMGEDQDLFCKAAGLGPIAYSNNVLAFYHLDASNRACERIIPHSECGFSKRVKALAELESSPTFQHSMLRYVASHLLSIAGQNVRAGRYQVAKVILKDNCCKRQPARYYWWKLRCWIGALFKANVVRAV